MDELSKYNKQVEDIIQGYYFENIYKEIELYLSKEEQSVKILDLKDLIRKYLMRNAKCNEKRINVTEPQYKTTINKFLDMLKENALYNDNKFNSNMIDEQNYQITLFCNELLTELKNKRYFKLRKLYIRKQDRTQKSIKEYFKNLKKEIHTIKSDDINEFQNYIFSLQKTL